MYRIKQSEQDVVKGLKCCSSGDCFSCPYEVSGRKCKDFLHEDAYVLVTTQRSEIEGLRSANERMYEELRIFREHLRNTQNDEEADVCSD